MDVPIARTSAAVKAKSLNISHAVSHFVETDFDFWAGFGPVCNTENF